MTGLFPPNHVFSTFIAMEPRGKERPRFVRATGRTFTPSRTIKAELAIRHRVQEEYRGVLIEGPVELHVTAWLLKPKSKPRKRPCWPTSKPDWDNQGKLVSDALNGVLWRDDSQVVRCVVQKVYCDSANPRPGFQFSVFRLDEVA